MCGAEQGPGASTAGLNSVWSAARVTARRRNPLTVAVGDRVAGGAEWSSAKKGLGVLDAYVPSNDIEGGLDWDTGGGGAGT